MNKKFFCVLVLLVLIFSCSTRLKSGYEIIDTTYEEFINSKRDKRFQENVSRYRLTFVDFVYGEEALDLGAGEDSMDYFLRYRDEASGKEFIVKDDSNKSYFDDLLLEPLSVVEFKSNWEKDFQGFSLFENFSLYSKNDLSKKIVSSPSSGKTKTISRIINTDYKGFYTNIMENLDDYLYCRIEFDALFQVNKSGMSFGYKDLKYGELAYFIISDLAGDDFAEVGMKYKDSLKLVPFKKGDKIRLKVIVIPVYQTPRVQDLTLVSNRKELLDYYLNYSGEELGVVLTDVVFVK